VRRVSKPPQITPRVEHAGPLRAHSGQSMQPLNCILCRPDAGRLRLLMKHGFELLPRRRRVSERWPGPIRAGHCGPRNGPSARTRSHLGLLGDFKLDRYDLLILDDISYFRKDQAETSVLFELIAERYERRSTLITAKVSGGGRVSSPTPCHPAGRATVPHPGVAAGPPYPTARPLVRPGS
jgi:hypothetical protein